MNEQDTTYRENPAVAEAPAAGATRLAERFERLVELYVRAKSMGRLDEELLPAIEDEFARIGRKLGLDFEVLLAEAEADATSSEEPSADEQTGLGLTENLDLRQYPDVVLTRAERREVNERAMNLLQKERAELTAEDIDVLRQYTGQGGLEAETAGEAVRKLNEHYTSYPLIRAMWHLLRKAGYAAGNVLEPGSGIGNFAGFAPDGVTMLLVERSNISARIAELLYPGHEVVNKSLPFVDWHRYDLTGAIGNVPFGDYSITPQKSPFKGLSAPIHDYFILKSIEQVAPGSPILLITSTGTMDKARPDIRREMMRRAALVDAFRLPSTMFQKNADTLVTTDLLILQKRPETLGEMDLVEDERAITFVATEKRRVERGEQTAEIHLSRYFAENPDRVLGGMEAGMNSQFLTQWGVEGDAEAAVETIRQTDLNWPFEFPKDRPLFRTDAGKTFRTTRPYPSGAIIYRDGTFYEKQARTWKETGVADTAAPRVRSATAVLDRFADYVAELARNNYADERPVIEALEAHIDEFGLPAEDETLSDVLRYDPRLPRLQTLAVRDEEGEIQYADLLLADNVYSDRYRTRLDDADDLTAVTSYLRANGEPLTPENYTSVWKGGTATEDEVVAAMRDSEDFFFDPENEQWVFRYEYLAGNVREKLQRARDEGIADNIAALEEVLPEQATVFDIGLDPKHVNTYLPLDVLEQWIADEIGQSAWSVSVKRIDTEDGADRDRYFDVEARRTQRNRSRGWGHEPYSKLVHLYLNERTIKRKVVDEEGNLLGKSLKEATAVEKGRANRFRDIWQARLVREIPRDFQQWVQTKAPSEIRERIEERYNALYNAHVNPPFDGLTFSVRGLADTVYGLDDFEIYPHNTIVAEKMLWNMGGGDCHDVGSGKTLAAIITAMAAKQRGAIEKPMFVVPGQVLRKWQREFTDLFPDAKTLVIELSSQRRGDELARAQAWDWDAIFIPDHAFKRLPLSPEERVRRLRRRITEFNRMIESSVARIRREHGAKHAKRMRKRLAKRLAKFETTLEEVSEIERDETDIFFDELGVDALFFDEAHFYKNALGSPKAIELGIAKANPSQRAEDALQKAQWIHEQTGGKNVWILTATPVKNSPIEVWHMMKLCAPNLLAKYNIEYLDDFVSLFVREELTDQKKVSGEYKRESTVAGYVNLPEMRRLIDEALDIKSYDQLQTFYERNPGFGQPFTRPDENIVTEMVEPSEIHELLFEDIELRAELVLDAMKRRRPGEDLPIRDNFLVLTSDGSKIATDLRVYSDEYDGFDHDSLKVRQVVENAVAYYRGERVPEGFGARRENPTGLTFRRGLAGRGEPIRDERRRNPGDETSPNEQPRNQIIFCDSISLSGGRSGSYHKLIKEELVAAGIPEEEIAIVNGGTITVPDSGDGVRETSPSADEKQELKLDVQERFNDGEYRILIGNKTIQEGMNLDRYGVATHHMDIPYVPADLQQRNGRMVRQGNVYDAVDVIFYLMEGSFDEYRLQLVRKKQSWVDELFGGTGRESGAQQDKKSLTYEEMQAATAKDSRVKEYFEALNSTQRLADEVASAEGEINRLQGAKNAAERDVDRLESRLEPTLETERRTQERGFPAASPEEALAEGLIRISGPEPVSRYARISKRLQGADEVFNVTVNLDLTESRQFKERDGMRVGLRVPQGNENARIKWNLRVPQDGGRRNFYGQKSMLNLWRYATGQLGEDVDTLPKTVERLADMDRYDLLADETDFFERYDVYPSDKPEDQTWEAWKDEIGMTDIERWTPIIRERLAALFYRAERRWYERSPVRMENLRAGLDERRQTLRGVTEELERTRVEYDRARTELREAERTVTELRDVVNEITTREYNSRPRLYDRINQLAPEYGVEIPVQMRIVGDKDAYLAFIGASGWNVSDVEPEVKDMLVDEGRENPSGDEIAPKEAIGAEDLVFIGTSSMLRTSKTSFEGEYVMLSTPALDRLILAPARRAQWARDEEPHPEADAAFEEWHRYEPTGNDLLVEIDVNAARPVGIAERIHYRSDKITQPGDERGQEHAYYHDFDPGAHPVWQLGDTLVVAPAGTLKINTNGKLGIVN